MNRAFRLALAFTLAGGAARAQQGAPQGAQEPQATGDTSIFAPLQMSPGPNSYRAGNGAPGPGYWQNAASYDIRATLDTAKKAVTGHLRMRYTNHSPQTLPFIWIQTEQNAFKSGSLNSYYYPAGSRFGARNFEGGDIIDRIVQVVGGKGAERSVPLKTRDNETTTYVKLAEPLAPGQTAVVDIDWHFSVPEHGADRMGRDGPLFELAQWYPRVNVFDDVKGWNTEPYLGQGEFYLEYGDYTYEVTVPAGYIVAGTGVITNPEEVLTATARQRLAQAAHSDTPVHIITAAEIANGTATPKKTGTATWRFAAKNVRDVAWAAAPNYIWDASSWKGIMAYAYYRPSAEDPWRDAADQARMSIQEYSERWFQYPWPQISAVEGPISGMEYPMLAMEAHSDDKYDLYNVVTHEIGHDWFPMIVGSNERTHFWMDEGFNTFINYFSEARRYPEKGTYEARVNHDRDEVEALMARDVDVPIDVPADRIDPRLLGVVEYVKTGVGLHLLRDEILGPETFDEAFRTYVDRWAYKHPTAPDFYRTMEDVSGRQLDWFWREWFETKAHFDQTIDTVAVQQRADTQYVAVVFGNRQEGVLPIRARFTFDNGTTQDVHYPAEVWATNTAHYIRQYAFPGKKLVKIELDPEHRLVDIDRGNNSWSAGAHATQ